MHIKYSEDKDPIKLHHYISGKLRKETRKTLTDWGLADIANDNAYSAIRGLGILCNILSEKGILDTKDILRITEHDESIEFVDDDKVVKVEKKHDWRTPQELRSGHSTDSWK